MRTSETIGWIIFGAALGAVSIVLCLDGPKLLAITLTGLCFLVAAPLIYVGLRRLWGDLMSNFSDLKSYRTAVGPFRFWTLLVGTVLFILLFAGADMWLSDKIGWPEAYGFYCRGRGCWIENLSHSPQLLRGGSANELALFALLWLMPAFVLGSAAYAIIKRRRRIVIQPLD